MRFDKAIANMFALRCTYLLESAIFRWNRWNRDAMRFHVPVGNLVSVWQMEQTVSVKWNWNRFQFWWMDHGQFQWNETETGFSFDEWITPLDK